MSDDTPSNDGQVRYRNTSPSDQEITDAVYRHTPAGTAEIAEVIGQSRQAAEYRLKHLEKSAPIWSKKVGPTRVWVHSTVMSRDFAP